MMQPALHHSLHLSLPILLGDALLPLGRRRTREDRPRREGLVKGGGELHRAGGGWLDVAARAE